MIWSETCYRLAFARPAVARLIGIWITAALGGRKPALMFLLSMSF